MRLRTICENSILYGSGYYGINEHGEHAACLTEIEIDIEKDSIEVRHGIIGPCHDVEWPRCHATLSWPQEWEVVEGHEKRTDRPL